MNNDAKSSARRLAATYATDMAVLAYQFQSIAHTHGFDLQVGMHAGSAAGAVIGTLRSFYCIYGETVNLSSRLCKLANTGQIRCSQGFVTCLNCEAHFNGQGLDVDALSSREAHGQRHCDLKVRMCAAEAQRAGDSSPPDSEMSLPIIHCSSLGLTSIKGFSESIVTFDVSLQGIASPRCCHLLLGKCAELFNVDAFSSGSNVCVSGVVSKETKGDMESLLQYSDLSAESLALLNDKKLSITKQIAGGFFTDSSIEDEYLEVENFGGQLVDSI